MNCIFCAIAEKQAPAEVVFETNKTISFLDVNPMNYGHILVVPKAHFPDLTTVPYEVIPELFQTAQKIAVALVEALKADGFNIVLNNGRAAGQSIFHCHIHVIPRYNSDNFGIKLHLKKYPEGELPHYASLIRQSLL
jgi:histidine triad (HIT) family protein